MTEITEQNVQEIREVLAEVRRCLQEIIAAANQARAKETRTHG